jgi:hypothetical protein
LKLGITYIVAKSRSSAFLETFSLIQMNPQIRRVVSFKLAIFCKFEGNRVIINREARSLTLISGNLSP